LPPPGLEGHGAYVWVPHAIHVDDATIQEENAPGDFPEDLALAEGHKNTRDDKEEYVAPWAADYSDFPEGYDFDKSNIYTNKEGELVV
jgi:hypothetical protein